MTIILLDRKTTVDKSCVPVKLFRCANCRFSMNKAKHNVTNFHGKFSVSLMISCCDHSWLYGEHEYHISFSLQSKLLILNKIHMFYSWPHCIIGITVSLWTHTTTINKQLSYSCNLNLSIVFYKKYFKLYFSTKYIRIQIETNPFK